MELCVPFEVRKAKKRHRHTGVYLALAHQQSVYGTQEETKRMDVVKPEEERTEVSVDSSYLMTTCSALSTGPF